MKIQKYKEMQGKNMKITVIKYGESVFDEKYLFYNGRSGVMQPISFVFYLIQAEDRKILVDVGCDDGAGFEMSVFRKPKEVLEEYGVAAGDITDVILTHAHHDHIEAIGYYTNAVIYMQKDAYLEGERYIPKDAKLCLFDQEYRLMDNLIIKKIGGHAVGSSIVLCGTYVFCGDECYVERCLKEKIPTGASCCEEKSRQFVEMYGDTGYIPLLFHDPGIMPGMVGGYDIECLSSTKMHQF